MDGPNAWQMMGGGGIGMVAVWTLAIVPAVLVVAWLLREFDGGRARARGRPSRRRPREAQPGTIGA